MVAGLLKPLKAWLGLTKSSKVKLTSTKMAMASMRSFSVTNSVMAAIVMSKTSTIS